MTSIAYSLMLLAAEGAPAAADDNGGRGGSGMLLQFIVPLIIVFVIMYIFIIAPQRKRDKQRRQMLSALGKGDEVVTIGGIRGTITQVSEEEVVLEVSDKVKMTFSRGAIARVVEDDGSKSE